MPRKKNKAENQEGIFRQMVDQFFKTFGFGSNENNPQGQNPDVQYFRNVQKIHGNEGYYFGRNPNLNTNFNGSYANFGNYPNNAVYNHDLSQFQNTYNRPPMQNSNNSSTIPPDVLQLPPEQMMALMTKMYNHLVRISGGINSAPADPYSNQNRAMDNLFLNTQQHQRQFQQRFNDDSYAQPTNRDRGNDLYGRANSYHEPIPKHQNNYDRQKVPFDESANRYNDRQPIWPHDRNDPRNPFNGQSVGGDYIRNSNDQFHNRQYSKDEPTNPYELKYSDKLGHNSENNESKPYRTAEEQNNDQSYGYYKQYNQYNYDTDNKQSRNTYEEYRGRTARESGKTSDESYHHKAEYFKNELEDFSGTASKTSKHDVNERIYVPKKHQEKPRDFYNDRENERILKTQHYGIQQSSFRKSVQGYDNYIDEQQQGPNRHKEQSRYFQGEKYNQYQNDYYNLKEIGVNPDQQSHNTPESPNPVIKSNETKCVPVSEFVVSDDFKIGSNEKGIQHEISSDENDSQKEINLQTSKAVKPNGNKKKSKKGRKNKKTSN